MSISKYGCLLNGKDSRDKNKIKIFVVRVKIQYCED